MKNREQAQTIFHEIVEYHNSGLSLRQKYARLYELLDRVCKWLTADYPSDYSNLFSRLYAICTNTGLSRNAIELFRLNAFHIKRGDKEPDESAYPYDLKALCEAVSFLLNSPIPTELTQILPKQWRTLSDHYQNDNTVHRIRFIVKDWDEQFIYGYSEEHPTESPLTINYKDNPSAEDITDFLQPGTQLNLLTVTSDEAGTLTPELMVFEPDYLIDISSLAECYQHYGNHPINYLIQKFKPRETTHHILLGNAANQFMDDCVNEQPGQPATYACSIQKVFRNELLAYSTCPNIDKDFFKNAEFQFNAIHDTMQALFESSTCLIDQKGAQVEPSFLCEALGLQGRMDFLQTDFRNLIELKSGKADGMGTAIHAKENHSLQMALYKEVLYYSLHVPREQVTSYLFYSRYPKLFAERSSKKQIQQAIGLRNHIVFNETVCKNDGGRELLQSITPEQLNLRHTSGKLWNEYQRPQLEAFLTPIHQADSITANYFFTFSAFITREQFLSKVGNARIDSTGGFSDTWNADTDSKLASGNILTDLKICKFKTSNDGIEKVVLELPTYNHNFLPNFRIGDIVMLYERNNENDKATNRQIIRGNLESIDSKAIIVGLRNKQRNPLVFNVQSMYAIEHDFMDSSYSTLYKGLYSLLTTTKERRRLLLGERLPRINRNEKLNGEYCNEQINQIVLQAKQAEDYFLLIGPPGTGKTSVALKSMVSEFHHQTSQYILLLAYTNRAVDEICDMLENMETAPEYLRIGNELACEERFRHRLLRNQLSACKQRSEVIQAIKNKRIVVGTVSSISGRNELFDLIHFDVAIIDEASQILEPHLMGILSAQKDERCHIDKFILIGDHKQLPAVVLQRPEESKINDEELCSIGITDCRNSLFERLYSQWKKNPIEGIVAMLDKQGRMHPSISNFVKKEFYQNRLDIIPLTHQKEALDWILPAQKHEDNLLTLAAATRLAFIHIPSPPIEESNKSNRNEAVVVAQLVKSIHQLCQTKHQPFMPETRIGIIVPFRNQIAMISNELEKLNIDGTERITIDTVERYQGSQRDIIIYSTTISQPYQLEMLSDISETDGYPVDRKLNVAITRARKQLFILGNKILLQQSEIYNKLIQFIRDNGSLVE